MTIRAKLVVSYVVMIVTIVAAGVALYWSMTEWRQAADNLGEMRKYSVMADRLRLSMQRQINFGLDYLSDGDFLASRYDLINEQTLERFEILNGHSLSELEADHIEGIEETMTELQWILSGIFGLSEDSRRNLNMATIRPRLREIADEVRSDIATLNQFYSNQVDLGVAKANQAGEIAIVVVGWAIALSLVQLIMMVLLTRRWLVRPFALVHNATEAISRGDLESRVLISSRDEWAALGRSINNMASSLATFQDKLRTTERFTALGEAAAYTAHNIRNPLAGIRSTVQLLEQESENLSSEDREALIEIISTVDRLTVWTKRFLDYARPLDLQLEASNLHEIITDALKTAQSKASSSETKVETNYQCDLPDLICDSILLEQTISAILANCLQSGAHRIIISTKYVIENKEKVEENVLITISDDGKGISPNVTEKLFRAFVTDKPGGTGLGLAQARKIVDLHEGVLSLESHPGEGTTVSILLPFVIKLSPMQPEENIPSRTN